MPNLLPFQKIGAAEVKSRSRFLLADDMGLGKTAQISIGTKAEKNLIIFAPSSLVFNWQDELLRFASRSSIIIESSNQDIAYRRKGKNTFILGYGMMNQYKHLAKLHARAAYVIDESHYLKSPEAKRTLNVMQLTNIATKVIGASGTPLINRTRELWSQSYLFDPFGLGMYNYEQFTMRYSAGHNGTFGWDDRGASNIPELSKRIRTFILRRTKEEVFKNFPALYLKSLIVNPLASGMQLQKEISKHIDSKQGFSIEHLTNKDDLPPVVLETMATLRKEFALEKVPTMIEVVKLFLDKYPNEKLVLFAHHREVIDSLYDAFNSPALKALKVYGGVTPKQKQAATIKFQNDPAYRIFIGNMQSAGVGLTLTKAAYCIFCELDWSPGNIKQAIDRLHRMTQERPVFIYFIISKRTYDEVLAHNVLAKLQTVKGLKIVIL